LRRYGEYDSLTPNKEDLVSVYCLVASVALAAPVADRAEQDTPDSALQRRSARQAGVVVRFTNSAGMEFVYIPPGRFLMGSPADEAGRDNDEGPQRTVTIRRAFYLGRHEVTQGQFQAVMGVNPSFFKGDTRRPVELVEWFDAATFCKKLTARDGRVHRLPTEAEWEYACRAGTATPFAFGKTLRTARANFDGTRFNGAGEPGVFRRSPWPVGRFAPNPWGLYDMHGNVWEWCLDWYDDKHYSAQAPGFDPRGPTAGWGRVMRGGAWNRFARGCRSADRGHTWPGNKLITLGFRVLCEQAAPARTSASQPAGTKKAGRPKATR
jgi:formylglycine-generating enzyme required for sulfatase activity